MRSLIFGLLLLAPTAHALDFSTSGALVEEVLSKSSEPHAWDWRAYKLQVELGLSTIDEANAFESQSYHLGVARPLSGRWLLRGAARKVTTSGTASTQSISQTPFSQAGLPSRYEFLAGAGYTLLDGRSATALSPRISDVGHALYALLGLQYNHFTNTDTEPLPGMRALYYKVSAEAGFRLQIFLPENLGLGLEWTYSRPLTEADPDLESWQRFSGSVSWSFY